MRVLIAVFSLLAAAVLPAQQPPAANAVPVQNEPHHRPVYENEWVRILDVRVPAGDSTLYHVHSHPMITVVIMAARQRIQNLGMQPSSSAFAIGQVIDNFDNALPYTHRVTNADTVPFQYVGVELLRTSGNSGPTLANTKTMQLVEDRRLARIYRIVLAPGESEDLEHHKQCGVLVQVSGGSVHVEGAKGDSHAGSWWWREPSVRNSVRNVGREPVELVQIDIE